MNEIDGRSSIFPKQVSTLFDFGMSWSHLSAFGPTFFENVTPLNVRAYFFPKMSFSVTPRCSGLLWVLVSLGCFGCSGLAFGYSGLLWTAMGCSGVLWDDLGCSVLIWAFWAGMGCFGLLWVVLGCFGVSDFLVRYYSQHSNVRGPFNIRVRMDVMARININTIFLLRCRICVVVS